MNYNELIVMLADSIAQQVFDRRTESLRTEILEEPATTYMKESGVAEVEFFANEQLPEDVFEKAKEVYLTLVDEAP